MKDILSLIVSELNGSVLVLLVVLVAVGFLLYALGRLQEKFKNQDEKLVDVRSNSEKLIELKTKVDLIYLNTNPNALVKSRSPLGLTEKGEKLSSEIEADKR